MGGLLGGVMIAGGVMSGLGAVTGNKKLAMIGGVLSLGAGVASAAGLASSANNLANSVTGAVPGDALFAQGTKTIGGVVNDAMGAVKGTLGVDAGTQGLRSAQGLQSPQGLPSVGQTGGAIGADYSLASRAGGGLPLPSQAAGAVPTDALATFTGQGLRQTSDMALKGATAGGGSLINGSTGVLGFINKNPELIKMGGGLISGGMKIYGEQQAAAQQQALIEQARARYNNSIINQQMTAPRAVTR